MCLAVYESVATSTTAQQATTALATACAALEAVASAETNESGPSSAVLEAAQRATAVAAALASAECAGCRRVHRNRTGCDVQRRGRDCAIPKPPPLTRPLPLTVHLFPKKYLAPLLIPLSNRPTNPRMAKNPTNPKSPGGETKIVILSPPTVEISTSRPSILFSQII
jgi:hypothetical protein